MKFRYIYALLVLALATVITMQVIENRTINELEAKEKAHHDSTPQIDTAQIDKAAQELQDHSKIPDTN